MQTVTHAAPKRPLLQFDLRDLCFVVFGISAAVVYMLKTHWHPVGLNHPAGIYIFIAVPSLIGSLIGVIAANMRRSGRIAAIALSVGGVWLLLISAETLRVRLLRSVSRGHYTMAGAICRHYAEAQEIYRRWDYDGDGILEYASSLGELIEYTPGTGNLALISRSLRNADDSLPTPRPRDGYFIKVLQAQGSAATGGSKKYVVNGNMTLGYGLVAYPAQYDVTDRETFIINNIGTIFKKDLGPNTNAIVRCMTEFNPDSTWAAAE